jgi:hypothetical protein
VVRVNISTTRNGGLVCVAKELIWQGGKGEQEQFMVNVMNGSIKSVLVCISV